MSNEKQTSDNQQGHAPLAGVMPRTIELCYTWPDGTEEVKYRRTEGTKAGDAIIREYERQKERGNSRYFIRYVA